MHKKGRGSSGYYNHAVMNFHSVLGRSGYTRNNLCSLQSYTYVSVLYFRITLNNLSKNNSFAEICSVLLYLQGIITRLTDEIDLLLSICARKRVNKE